LNPLLKSAKWSEHENWTLFLLVETYGKRWADITKYLLGRSDNSIKNRWNCLLRKQASKYRSELN
jgi:hypothetical protein